jgi:uncharacterized membrane protein
VQTGGRARDRGIDVARGLAVLLMFQTHAYDAYVAPAARATMGFRVTRELGAAPAPSFLLLAGVGLAFGELAMARAGVEAAAIRARFVRRGLEVAATGYLVSAIYALIDRSAAPETLLRADILHAIGLGLALVAALLVGRPGRRGVVAAFALVVASLLVPIALGDTLARVFPAQAGWAGAWARAPLALLVDVPGYTRFPLLPLVGFVAIGVLVGRALAVHGAAMSPRTALALLALCVGGAALASLGTRALVEALAMGPLRRAHPAVVLNVVDGMLRAGAVLALGLLCAARLPARVLAPLVRLGRGSLLAYGVHIPGCYGALARPLARRFDLTGATLVLVGLGVVTYVVVFARDVARDWLRSRRGPHIAAGGAS